MDEDRKLEQPGQGPPRPRASVRVAGAAAVAFSLIAAGYAGAAIAGTVPMTMPVFIGWIAALYLVNLLFLWLFWKKRLGYGIGPRLLMLLWGPLFLWYWLPAPIYYFLNMNLDELQFRWAAFAWIWEVPAVGGGLHVALCYRLFRPIQAFMESRQAVRDPAGLYRWVLRYPVVVAVMMFAVSVIGYTIGAAQFRLFAAMPLIEQCKNVTNGVTVSLFLGIIYYLFLDGFLSPVRARLEQEHGLSHVVQRKITRRIFGVTLFTTLGSIALLSLFVLQSFQLVTREHVARQLSSRLETLLAKWPELTDEPRRAAAMKDAQLGSRGRVFLLEADEPIRLVDVSRQTQRIVAAQASGMVYDLKSESKLVGFAKSSLLGRTLVAVAYLTDFYSPLPMLGRSFGIACVYVIFLTVGIITIMTIASTRAIALLSAAVRRAVTSAHPYTMHVHSADEIEELSHAFAYFASQSETLRQNLEEKLKELARSNADLEQFAYIASHDLQEPLRTVASYTQLLARRYQGRLDADADEYIAYVVGGVTRMYTLINDLLAYARVDTRGKPLEPTDSRLIVEQALAGLQRAITDSGASVRYDDLPVVLADPSQLSQVFQNLLSNALKFRRPGAAPEIRISAQWRDAQWVFTVQDNGIGLDPQYADRLFVLFHRLHSQTEYPGTGIGLAVCKKIVERHGGRIWVEAALGRGASFRFTLPAAGVWSSARTPGRAVASQAGAANQPVEPSAGTELRRS